ncbi:hypothetical protein [Roseovarius aestuarii]|nr:hypothetical protein [Roseovarius aestuarii]
MVPPSYDLVGTGSANVTIRFTGETRTAAGPPAVTYWGGEAIYAGRNVRGLTLIANPAPMYSCRGMRGIFVQNDGSVIEDVIVDLNTAAAPPPDSRGNYDIAFQQQIVGEGIEIVVLDCACRNASRTGLGLHQCSGMITRTDLFAAALSCSDSAGLTVDTVNARGAQRFDVNGNVRVQDCTIGDRADAHRSPILTIKGDNPTAPAVFGPNNIADPLYIFAYGNVVIENNTLSHHYQFDISGPVRVIDNSIEPEGLVRYLLTVQFDENYPGVPVIQNNRFVAPSGPSFGGHHVNPIIVRASADFGGGASLGNNNLGALFVRNTGFSTSADGDLVRAGTILVDPTDEPEAIIRFDNNLWDDTFSLDSLATRRFHVSTTPAVLSVGSPRPAP